MRNPIYMQISKFISPKTCLLKTSCTFSPNALKCTFSTKIQQNAESASSERYHAYLKTKRISKAMETYLKATREKAELLQKENVEFELGKRHLANMMGLDPDTMTQDDVDEAIKYLLPSGLFSPRSRPTMKPPSYYYPPIKPAEFAEDGRPFDDMFYTLRPRFYQHLYNVYEKIEILDKHASKVKQEVKDTPEEDSTPKINLVGSKWPDKNKLEELFVECLTDENVKQFVAAMDHLTSHTCAYLEKDFVMHWRVNVAITTTSITEKVTETKVDQNGRSYAEAEARRKSCDAVVKVYTNGTGKFDIDGNDLMQFLPHARECVLFPFMILDRYDQFDVFATTKDGGVSSRAGAVRFGICKALCPFITEQEIEKLTLAGLLSRDIRRKERNKWNHYGARTKPKWKRR